ncbi:DNA-methyltransferase [Idiomarina zobellii]|uniref:Methyltransferase n=1 Tax=Idiomarina zobellii TaxID=86103 RepID=A0A837NDI6_9GAMM|nr:site-specific DNA-methyltransferase [Idiomarina zobellii]KPD24033.1 modification methylase [Idiomarina zobellii]SDF82641.1 DNA modification methylase [Idiomarina zobellii]
MKTKMLVSETRGYKVSKVSDAKLIAENYLSNIDELSSEDVEFGLPEIDDRFHIWRVPVKTLGERIGEVVINAKVATIDEERTTKPKLLLTRQKNAKNKPKKTRSKTPDPVLSPLQNSIIKGDAREQLKNLPEQSVNLVFTSPPYYNAKPEYSEYSTYEEYLELMRQVIRESARCLSEGRFFVMNVSPVLLRRASRSESSKRIAVPFDMHRLFIEEGFEFVDDIHWVKPEGAGWSFGRGRRFAADRNPLQYKPVPITEYILVYRKKTKNLIDWNIRKHPDQAAVLESKVDDDYEKTNIWRINPSRSKVHPATFPLELAEKVIKYYSFQGDVVLDPFGGIGTTARAALNLRRRFVMCEISDKYVEHMKEYFASLKLPEASRIELVNTEETTSMNQAFDI